MIFYITKEMNDYYDLLFTPEANPEFVAIAEEFKTIEKGDELLEWGATAFYFDYRMSIQVINYATKLTLFLMYVPYDAMEDFGNFLIEHLEKLYEGDDVMLRALHNMYKESMCVVFDRLYKKSIIHSLSFVYKDFLNNGDNFINYVKDNILHSIILNKELNFKYKFNRVVNGVKEEYCSGKLFRKEIIKRFGKKKKMIVKEDENNL